MKISYIVNELVFENSFDMYMFNTKNKDNNPTTDLESPN